MSGPVNEIGLPACLRLALEDKLGSDAEFRAKFAGEIGLYRKHISDAFEIVLQIESWKLWCDQNGIDIITWHYLTRHLVFKAAASNEYFSGQVVLNAELKKIRTDDELEPYPRKKSPYIDAFKKDERRRQEGHSTNDDDFAGPVCILLPDSEEAAELKWALSIPSRVTKLLRTFPEHDGSNDPLRSEHLSKIEKADPDFIERLTEWMPKRGGQSQRGPHVEPLKAINYLQASLKVTLKLLRTRKFNCSLPRSTFLCPAYVGRQEVGGMAVACSGLVSRNTALVGEAVSDVLLSYLRLRENAEDAAIFEQQRNLDEARRFFIDRLSHDLRHPLDNLQSTAKDLEEKAKEQVRLFSVVRQQIKQANQIVDETILALEGRDPNKLLKPKKRDDQVSEFLADIRAYFRRRFEDENKQLNIVLPPDGADWKISLDAGMVHEILENLILNALEHGGPKTSVSVERNPSAYCIHVRDNGSGIPAEQREVIFRPLVKSSQAEGPLRGRGLAIARMLAEAHGGTLQLALPSGEWKTDFVLEIPIEDGSRKQ